MKRRRLLEADANVNPDNAAWCIVEHKKEFKDCNSAVELYRKAKTLLEDNGYDSTPWAKWFIDGLKQTVTDAADKARAFIDHLHDTENIAEIGLQVSTDRAPLVLAQHKDSIMRQTSVDGMLFNCNRFLYSDGCGDTDFAKYVNDKLVDFKTKSNEAAWDFFDYAVPTTAAIPPEGSAGRILFEHAEELYDCKTVEDILVLCTELFDDADLLTDWTTKFLNNLRTMIDTDREVDDAKSYIANVINRACHLTDRRHFHESDGESAPTHSIEEIQEAIKYWES